MDSPCPASQSDPQGDAPARHGQARRTFLLASVAGGWLSSARPLVGGASNGKVAVAGLKIEGDRHGVVTVRSPAGERLYKFRMGAGRREGDVLARAGQDRLRLSEGSGGVLGISHGQGGPEPGPADLRIFPARGLVLHR